MHLSKLQIYIPGILKSFYLSFVEMALRCLNHCTDYPSVTASPRFVGLKIVNFVKTHCIVLSLQLLLLLCRYLFQKLFNVHSYFVVMEKSAHELKGILVDMPPAWC